MFTGRYNYFVERMFYYAVGEDKQRGWNELSMLCYFTSLTLALTLPWVASGVRIGT